MTHETLSDFLIAATPPRDGHASGTLDVAESIRAAHPDVQRANILACAVLGDADGVRAFIEADPASATSGGGPFGWDALTHLCFSRYLRIDHARSDGFVRAATLLLDAGASANSGWFETAHQPVPEWESVLYGAAGIAHHPGLTRLLLERGADLNDNETVYHAPETRDNRALAVLLETGRVSRDHLRLMLIRKHDWHDYDGVKLVLEHGADPNGTSGRGLLPIHHALARDNALEMFVLLLDYGADPMLTVSGMTAVARAARCGRGDVLELFDQRGISTSLSGVDGLIAACARGDGASSRAMVSRTPALVPEIVAGGGALLARFSLTDNPRGVELLLDLGVPVTAAFAEGDGYFGIPKHSLSIDVAAWLGRPDVVRLLLERGSPVDVADGHGQTPLALAVRACVQSYWTERRTPESVRLLLAAGASAWRVPFPSGYDEVDALLASARSGRPP